MPAWHRRPLVALGAVGYNARMMRRLSSLALAAAVFAGTLPASALAAETISVASLKNPCKNKSGTEKSKCMSDAINAADELLHDFGEMQEAERKQWYDEHASMGVTNEYRKLLAAFIAKQKAALDLFKADLAAFRKEVSDAQKALKGSVKTGNNGYARRVTKDETAAAKAACAKETDNDRQRICLRRALRTEDPNAKGWAQRK